MVGISKVFWSITLLLVAYAIFFDFPISGDTVFISWLIIYFVFALYTISNKTELRKNPKTGSYEEVTRD
jgi:hypothetical protein